MEILVILLAIVAIGLRVALDFSEKAREELKNENDILKDAIANHERQIAPPDSYFEGVHV